MALPFVRKKASFPVSQRRYKVYGVARARETFEVRTFSPWRGIVMPLAHSAQCVQRTSTRWAAMNANSEDKTTIKKQLLDYS